MQKMLGEFLSNSNFTSLIWGLLIGVFFCGFGLIIGKVVRIFLIDKEKFSASLNDYLSTDRNNDPEFIIYAFESRLSKATTLGEVFIKFCILILPLLGLLGTFIGLIKSVVESLAIFNNADVIVEVSEITHGISRSFDGVSYAFLTSIVGISLSIVLLFINNICISYSRIVINKITEDLLPNIINRNTSNDSPQAIIHSIRNLVTESIKSFQTSLIDSYDNIEEWAKDLVKTQTKSIIENTSQTYSKIDKIIDQLELEREVLNIMKDNWKKSIELLSESSEKIFITSKIFTDFNKPYEKLVDIINDFAERFNELFDQVNEVVRQVTKPSTMYDNITTSLATNSNLYKAMIDEQIQTRSVLSHLDQKIEASIVEILKTYTVNIERLSNDNLQANRTLVKDVDRLNKNILSSIKDLITVIDVPLNNTEKQINCLIDEQIKSRTVLSNFDKTVTSAMEEQLKTINKFVYTPLNNTSENPLKSIEESSKRVEELVAKIEISLHSLEKLNRNLGKLLS